MLNSAQILSITLCSLFMVSKSILTINSPLFNGTNDARSHEERFCSNSYIHQSQVKYEILGSGEIRARAQVMITLRAGETVCLRAELVNQNKDSINPQKTEQDPTLYKISTNKIEPEGSVNSRPNKLESARLINDSLERPQSIVTRRGTRSTLEEISKQKEGTARSEFKYSNSTEENRNSWNYYQVRSEQIDDVSDNNLSRDKSSVINNGKQIPNLTSPEEGRPSADDSKSRLDIHRNDKLRHQSTKESLSLFRDIVNNISSPKFSNSEQNYNNNPRNPLPNDSDHFYIRITADRVRFHYPILSSYEFAEPAINITCTCACAAFHSCSPCGTACVDLAVIDETVRDCSDSLLGVAHTCCHVQLTHGALDSFSDGSGSVRGYPSAGRVLTTKYRAANRFRAVQLGRPISVIDLTFDSSRRLGSNQKPARVHVPLGGEFSVDLDETQLNGVSGGWTEEPLQPGWHVIHNDRLYRTPHINRHGEYNLRKLGWLKIEGNELLIPSAERLRTSIQVTTDSCTKQKFQIKEDILLDSVPPQLGEPASSIDSMTVTSQHVTVTASRHVTNAATLWLSLAFEHVQTIRPVIDQASLSDFDGHLLVNNRSQAEAKLRLEGASGLIRGTVRVDYTRSQLPDALFHFSWQAGTGSENTIEVRSFLLPVAFGEHQSEAEMCLQPSPGKQEPICRVLRIVRQQRSPLPADKLLNRHLLVNSKTNPTNKIEQFVRSLNPANWLSPSSWSWTTALGAIVDSVLLLVAASLAWKCLGCCISCFKRKKK